jgi:hypothetical protein
MMATRYIVILFIEGFLDEPASGHDWNARPLVTTDPRWTTVVEAWAAFQGAQTGPWDQDASNTVLSNVVAIQSSAEASDADSAIAAVRDRLLAVSRGIEYRQLLPRRVVTWVAIDPTTGQAEARRDVVDPPRVYHRGDKKAGWTAGAHIESVVELMATAPKGDLFAALFAEAMSQSPEVRLILLWSLLEVLSEAFRPRGRRQSPGASKSGKLAQVEEALSFLGVQGEARLEEAYALRNEIVHEGKRDDAGRAESLASDLIKVTAKALQRSGFQPIDRARPAVAPPDAWPVQTQIAPASARRPW